jgi:hypothetical protein
MAKRGQSNGHRLVPLWLSLELAAVSTAISTLLGIWLTWLIFDSNILWIFDRMQLIDGNQHTRLRSWFELRCQSDHPLMRPLRSTISSHSSLT